MVQLYGKVWTRAELSRYVADMGQLAGIRPVTYSDGPEAGVRALEFRTGAGLSFTVLADRAMDVGLAEIDGVPLSFMTGVGYAHPAYYSAHESDWLRAFPGGLFVTVVDPRGPAAPAGLRVRDIVTVVDGQQATSVDDLWAVTFREAVGDQVVVTYLRGGDTMTTTVTLAAPSSPEGMRGSTGLTRGG